MHPIPFHFDAAQHEYTNALTGEIVPHITGLLQRAGWIDDRWFTDESSERGTAVHRLCADFDLGMLNAQTYRSVFKGYLAAHVRLMTMINPRWLHIEEPLVHPAYRFAGRPDRIGFVHTERCVFELKTAIPQKSHQIQTALQAILDSAVSGLPPHATARYCAYYKPNGTPGLVPNRDRRDFDEAFRILKAFC